MYKIVILIMMASVLSGCGGLGFHKKATLMPDEVSVQGDLKPNHGKHGMGMHISELTGGLKWKLK